MADLTGTSYTGTTWPGSYGPSGQLYYYGGKAFNSPQELYAALGQPYDAGSLPYGTTVYGQGYNSGMSPWDQSVRNNPLGYLDQPTGSTASLFANPSSATTPTGSTTAPTTAAPATTASTTGTTGTTAAGTAATGTTGATTTGTTGTGAAGTVNPPAGNFIPGPGSTTPVEPFNPMDDPRQSVYRALLANGYNPDVPTWGINQLQKRAADLVMSAMGRTAWGGNPNTLTEPGEFQNYINSLVGQSGKMGIMPTAAQGKDYLNSINTLMNGARSPGATYLSSLFGADPGQAAAASSSLLYGGLAPSVRGALAGPLANYETRLRQYAETPEGFGVARDKNTLDILLNNLIPGYRPLF